MTWLEHHTQSVKHAIQAEIILRNDDSFFKNAAIKQYLLAAEAEGRAFDALRPEQIRTISITAVSVASLWYKANDFKQAEIAVRKGLAIENLQEFAVLQLESILQAIKEQITK